MTVYVLVADTYNEAWGSDIRLFGVFSTEEKAYKHANETELDYYDIYPIKIDENEEPTYLGGYIE